MTNLSKLIESKIDNLKFYRKYKGHKPTIYMLKDVKENYLDRYCNKIGAKLWFSHHDAYNNFIAVSPDGNIILIRSKIYTDSKIEALCVSFDDIDFETFDHYCRSYCFSFKTDENLIREFNVSAENLIGELIAVNPPYELSDKYRPIFETKYEQAKQLRKNFIDRTNNRKKGLPMYWFSTIENEDVYIHPDGKAYLNGIEVPTGEYDAWTGERQTLDLTKKTLIWLLFNSKEIVDNLPMDLDDETKDYDIYRRRVSENKMNKVRYFNHLYKHLDDFKNYPDYVDCDTDGWIM